MTGSHLTEAARSVLSGTPEERKAFVRQPRWINYPQAVQALNLLEDLLIEPKKDRMPNLMLWADTTNGKTHIIRRFQRLHPASDQPGKRQIRVPVLYFQAPPVSNESRFWDKVLMSLFATFKPGDSAGKKHAQALLLLKEIELGVIVIDEIHDMLSGQRTQYQPLLNTIKQLGTDLQVPIVAVGTRAARRVINTDPQLGNRFDSFHLPTWKFNDDYLQLLADIERVLPLPKASQLYQEALARHILNKTEGSVGEIIKFITQAAIKAIDLDKPQINRTILDSVRYVSPSKRRREGEIVVGHADR